MTEWHGIQQFEYRWQPAKDLSLIAGSQPAAAIQPWSDRMALWMRHRAVEAPTQSVRYEIFDDGMAALAWRERNAQAIESGDRAERGRPEVSRVLMGPVRLLTPEVAVAVCLTGLPQAIGPRPGQFPVGSSLPAIDPAELTGLARDMAGQLDRLAMYEPGLQRVIAAALTDRDTALSVQLPQRVIARPPQDGSQGPLLWGLRRIVWPLLGHDSGKRGWSFSTYEPPLGDVDTGALADIVFRAHQAVQPGLSSRREILVRPHDPVEPPAAILYQDFAGMLVDAYKYLGGERLGRHLDAVGGDYPSVDKRIEGVQATLYAVLPPSSPPVPSRHYLPAAGPAVTEPEEVPPDRYLAPAEIAAPPGAIDTQEDAAPPDGAIPPASPAAPPPAAPQSWTPRAPGPALGAPNRAKEDAPPLPATGTPREPAEPAPPYSVSSLLDQLSAGPAGRGFESALQSLRTGRFPDWPADRAAARKLIAERNWYIPVLQQYDSAHLDDMLEAIFRLAVIPDLGSREVTEEVVRWAGERAAPPRVIMALTAAAQRREGAPELMRQALELPLGRRWLAENGIPAGPPAYAAPAPRSQGAHPAGGPGSQWALLNGRFRGDPVTLLALSCAVLIALLVVALMY